MSAPMFVEFKDVCKYYQMGDQKIAASDHISFQIGQGRILCHCWPQWGRKKQRF